MSICPKILFFSICTKVYLINGWGHLANTNFHSQESVIIWSSKQRLIQNLWLEYKLYTCILQQLMTPAYHVLLIIAPSLCMYK
jgi:hypothetical protein